jgi:menaquinol-cytochrome c reductase iron-sulfur subunit
MSAQQNRRGFLSFLTKALLALIGVCMAIPAFAYLCAPLRKRRDNGGHADSFVNVGPVKDFPIGEWRLVSLDLVRLNGWEKSNVRHALWVRREREGDQAITVLSPLCPHLGCPINWHAEQKQFVCPCHGGIFDATGHRRSGPPPRGMDSLEHEVRAGRLWVRWQDFKVGVAQREPVTV